MRPTRGAARVALDTSVAIPYLMASHDAHHLVRTVVGTRSPVLTAHSLAETYAVITRLPGDARVAPGDASTLIDGNFGAAALLSEQRGRAVHRDLSGSGVSGGAVYDGLVALAAQDHDLVLLTRDARAITTYIRLGVMTELVG